MYLKWTITINSIVKDYALKIWSFFQLFTLAESLGGFESLTELP